MAYVSTLTKSIITHSTLSSVELLEEYIYIWLINWLFHKRGFRVYLIQNHSQFENVWKELKQTRLFS